MAGSAQLRHRHPSVQEGASGSVAAYCIYRYNKRVTGIERVTRQLLDLLAVLLDAYMRGEEVHGYALMKRAGLSGPSTYRNLDRLEDADLVEARWEEFLEGDRRPRRCYYRLNPAGAATARELLAERPEVLERLGRTPPGRFRAPKPGFGTLFAALAGHTGGVR